MFGLPAPFGTIVDLLVVIFGFGLIIFVHELGHFVAARWAGIRVMAFALGFGPALLSYRKGMGLRRGSSEPEYLQKRASSRAADLSPTEYRLNILPLGGYVKMLGQDDMDPGAVSSEKDSYQAAKPWKRLIVISAGVVMNVITAAILFVIVFMVGLKVEPPKIGSVEPASPAARAVATNAAALGIDEAGLKAGDEILSINGRTPNSFADLVAEVAMTARDKPAEVLVRRAGHDEPLVFAITPQASRMHRLLSIGVEPVTSLTVRRLDPRISPASLEALGLGGIASGMRITAVNGQQGLDSYHELAAAFSRSAGQPVLLTLADDVTTIERRVEPVSEIQLSLLPGADETALAMIDHVLGLTPVMRVADGPQAVEPQAAEAGLQPGDVFVRVGNVEYPSLPAGIREVRAHAGKTIELVVLRSDGDAFVEVPITAKVSSKGTIGFRPLDSRDESTLLALPPAQLQQPGDEGWHAPAAGSIISTPGQRIVAVNGRKVENFSQLRSALQQATANALDQDAVVDLMIEMPLGDKPIVERQWTIPARDVRALHELTWVPPFSEFLFEQEKILLRADTPLAAVGTGLAETRRVLITTYITFARLFQQTVKIEHLKGPVGIAHTGTIIAERGWVWVLFFMAMISVNLAVINFLPLPIVDGGQFLMIVYEMIRGRPVPIAFQNVVTMAGLILIMSLFLVVTFNDVKNLLGL